MYLKPNRSFDYPTYRQLIAELHKEGKSTAPKTDQALLDYSQLNAKRMDRWDKQAQVLPELKDLMAKIHKPYTWMMILESWCGDAAQNTPIIAKIADESDLVELQLILRDENPEIMDQFLTNGGRSIPKLVCYDSEKNVIFTWGSRPKQLQDLVMAYKEKMGPKQSMEEFAIEIQRWYNNDKTQTVQSEFIELIKTHCLR